MERKPDTPVRKSRRKYEERNKDERKEKNKVWGTSIDRKFANEIDEFLDERKGYGPCAHNFLFNL